MSWETLARVIADCRHYLRARQIVIRWHPSMLEPPRLSHRLSDTSGIVESPKTAKLVDVARQCDWVIADESWPALFQALAPRYCTASGLARQADRLLTRELGRLC